MQSKPNIKIMSTAQAPSKDILTSAGIAPVENEIDITPAPQVVPMVSNNKDTIVLPFDEVPGPKSLKYLSTWRNYLTEIGTQITAGFLTFSLNIGKSSEEALIIVDAIFRCTLGHKKRGNWGPTTNA